MTTTDESMRKILCIADHIKIDSKSQIASSNFTLISFRSDTFV